MAEETLAKSPELTILAELSERIRLEKEEKQNVSTMPEIGTTRKSEINTATPDVDGEIGPNGDKRTKPTDNRTEEKQDITYDKNVTNDAFSENCSDNKTQADVEVIEESHTAKGQQVEVDQPESQSDQEDGENMSKNAKQTRNLEDEVSDDESGSLLPGIDLPEKDRITLLEAELMKARKEMRKLNKKLAKSRRSEEVNQSLLVAIQTKNKDLREENLGLKERVQLLEGLPMHLQQGLSLNNDASTNSNNMKKEPVEEVVMPDYDYLANELAQNPSRRKQRCPRPVKLKRGRPRSRKSVNGTESEPLPKRNTPRRKSAQVKGVVMDGDQDENSDHREEEEQEEVDDKADPEFVIKDYYKTGDEPHDDDDPEEFRELRGKFVPRHTLSTRGRKLVNRNLPCKHCSRRFRTYTDLNKHMTEHNKERTFKCKRCSREFPAKCSYVRHVLACTSAKVYECEQPKCSMTFRLMVDLRNHLKTVHGIVSFKPHVCEICNKGFARKNALKEHKSIHTGEMNFQCSKCGESFRYHSAYHIHMQKQHPKKDAYKCTLCPETFPESVLLRQHMEFHEGIRKFRCETCGKAFEKEQGLSKHIFQSHKATEKQICYLCETEVEDFVMLKEHFRVQHPGNRNLKCQFCDRTFNTLPDLDEHHRRHTGEGWVKCPVCDREFLTKDRLQQHMRVHTQETPWLCSVCGAKFSLHSSYRYHIRYMHTEDRPHTCSQCGKSFKRAPHLKEHARIHTGIRPHICELCGKSFVRLSHLKKHERIHQGIKPHVCTVCGHAFVEKHNLKQHERTHMKGNKEEGGSSHLKSRRSSNKQPPVAKQPPKENDVQIQREEYSHQQQQSQVQQRPQAQQQPHPQQQQQQQSQPQPIQVQQQATKYAPQPYIEQTHGAVQWSYARDGYGILHKNPQQVVMYSTVDPIQQETQPPHTTAAQQHVIQPVEYPPDVTFAVNIVSQ